MTQADFDQSKHQTHRFLYSRWVARRTAAVTMVIFYAILLYVLTGHEQRVSTWIAGPLVGIVFLTALGFLIISRHPITRLTVGPGGISTPFGLQRRVGWGEIETISFVSRHPLFLPQREWLIVSLKPGAPPLSRIPLPGAVQQWLHPKDTMRIPLHVLRAKSNDVIFSVERFVQVTEIDPVAHPTTTY